MTTQFQKNMQYFEKKGQLILITVKINDREYELEVRHKHTIKMIKERFQRNKFMKGEPSKIKINQQIVKDQTEFIEKYLKQDGDGNMPICVEFVDKKNQIGRKEQSKETNHNKQKKQSQNQIKKQPKSIQLQTQSKSQNTQSKKQQKAQQKQKLQQKKQQSKQHTINLKELTTILQKIQSSQPLNKIFDQKYIQFAKVLEQKFDTFKSQLQKLRNLYEITNNFNKDVLKSLQQCQKQIKIVPQKYPQTSKKNKNKIHDYGNDQQKILNITYNMRQYLNHVNKQIDNLKQNYQSKSKQNQKLVKQLQQQQIEKLAIQQQLLSKSRQQTTAIDIQNTNTYTNNTNPRNQYQICTNYLNSQLDKKNKYMDFLVENIQSYEEMKVNEVWPLISLGKGEFMFQAFKIFLDTFNFSGNTRIILIIEVQNQKLMGIYSTIGISKKGNNLESKSKIYHNNTKSIGGFGFVTFLNENKIFNSSNQSQIMAYDEKMLTFGHCFVLLNNIKNKLQIQYKQVKKSELRNPSNFDISKMVGQKNKAELVKLQLFRVQLSGKQEEQKNILVFE